MSAVLLAALLSTQPEPYRIDLVSITVDDARTLNGRRVRVSFTTGCPSSSIDGLTATGPGEQPADRDASPAVWSCVGSASSTRASG
ncbi:MAG TPA: hypothetical protein VKE74_11580 [Gemmataceae bacterium]|nr:hypothetical protein [Gemmataceae bacterium]